MAYEESWDEVVDVVVAGSGAGGFSAAVTAAEQGLDVLILEKAAAPGGTTRKSAGVFWLLNNRFMREAGVPDPKPEALRYLARTAHPTRYNPDAPMLGLAAWEHDALEAFYDHGAEALEFFEGVGAIDVGTDPDYPDYHAQIPEDAAPTGRMLYPAAGQRTAIGGRVLIDELGAAAAKDGVELRTATSVVDLVIEDGEVRGVVARSTGRDRRIRARAGVVFATGGFTHNADLRTRFLRGPYAGGCAAVTNTGDFIPLALRAGAELVNMANAWSAPIVLERLLRDPATVAGSFIMPGDALIVVNRQGRRVLNERMNYNEATQAYFAWDGEHLEYPNLPLIAIWDAEVAAKAGGDFLGNPIPLPDVDPYWVVRGETLDELRAGIAERLPIVAPLVGRTELDPGFTGNLEQTIARFNGFAATGVDEDFHRGTTPHELYHAAWYEEMWGVTGGPNPTMRPLSGSGPYYATLMGPGTLDTKGGPRVDPHGRVVRSTGEPIPGLYGVGNCVGSPSGQGYWAAGGTLGPIITYGYLAGLAVASDLRSDRDLLEAVTR
jgi:3-oxosteroid 1-dehydrogenase